MSVIGTPASALYDSPLTSFNDNESQASERKRKRARPVLVCKACKRRRIKCDRNLPCDSCIKRGEADSCEWDPQVEPERASYVSVDEFEALKSRLEHLEASIHEKRTLDTCCPPSCACHEAPAARSRATTLVVEEDLPLSILIDQQLGFRRDSELARGGGGCCSKDSEDKSGSSLQVPGALRTQSSPWIEDRPVNPVNKSASTRIPLLAYYDSDTAIQLIQNAIPKKQACDVLVQTFFQEFAWSCHVLHTPSFMREYELFWTHIDGRSLSSADPAWLALFLMVLANGVRCLTRADLPRDLQNYTHAEVEQWPELFFESSQMALKLAQWATKPQIRVLQTVLLFLPYLDFTSESPDTLVWIAVAAKITQLLDLQNLTVEGSKRLKNDLALPCESCSGSLRQQLAYRLYICTSSADMMTRASMQGWSQTLPSQDALAHLSNCNDIELDLAISSPARNDNDITDITFEMVKYRLAAYHQQYNKTHAQAEGTMSAMELGFLERSLRAILEDIAEPPVPPGGAPYSSSTGQLLKRYHMIRSAVHYRLLRLHRPYMQRGYTEGNYAKSASVAVESALIILQSNARFRSVSTSSAWFFILHCIEAVVVIFVDIFWKMDHAAPAEAIQQNKSDLIHAANTFSAAAGSFSAQIQRLAQLGQGLLPALLEEETSRMMTPVVHREPISEIFKRTALALRGQEKTSEHGQEAGSLPSLNTFATGISANPPLSFNMDTSSFLSGGGDGDLNWPLLDDVFSDFTYTLNAPSFT